MSDAIFITSLFMTLFCSAQQLPNIKNDSVKKASKISVTPSLDFENKTEVADSTFIIPDNPQEVYRGFYKENKPYNGYFKVGDNDIFWVELYKNGEKTNQYSVDILEIIKLEEKYGYSENRRTTLNIKSTFKNEEIVNGELIETQKDAHIKRMFVDGEIIKATVDVFAMHYFNRLSLKIDDNKIFITHLKDSISRIRVSPNNRTLLVELLVDNTIIASNNLKESNSKNPKPNSLIRVFKINDRKNCLIINKNADFENYRDNLFFLQNLIMSPAQIDSENNKIGGVLDFILEEIMVEDKSQKEPLATAFISTDKNGIIEEGIYWEEAANNTGSYKIYKDGKIIKKAEVTLLDFQNTLKDYFNQDN